MTPVSIRYFAIEWLSKHDGPGARVVVFLQGCHFACPWCHSPHSSFEWSPILFFKNLCLSCNRCQEVCPEGLRGALPTKTADISARCRRCGACVVACPASRPGGMASALVLPTQEATPETLFATIQPQLEMVRKIGGLTLSGGEALLQGEAVAHLLRLARDAGFHTTVETSGLLPLACYQSIAALVDCWLFGLRSDIPGAKAADRFGMRGSNLHYLASLPSRIVVRKPLVAGYTDTEEEIEVTIDVMKECGVSEIQLLPLNPHSGHYYSALGLSCPEATRATPTAAAVATAVNRFTASGFTVTVG
ncbi:glycyl radical enzyme-activating radical SAM domain iron-sulfur cluster-binding oxidoreductase [Geotalea daltonii FRC-32]|uniref:Glycyl radical enzyme-activating radical SAM domain iron-sulfur cluster-binding oxidoreductase n=1 Tax=Geotalea daltonii (strain DSM 22248 / JCM 15807 / FRC-32) TaxID=316067 RepID=B9M4R6_GEODF|nr:4Fe-4S cluster-binding domain-containing protein [Geotalea daltonii]ACM21600.1 glycyl radical enzyme-activating radical SAM domain iron-sulfur cluster-binding oxidoreductase [Geotalea daltonii FRC-32]